MTNAPVARVWMVGPVWTVTETSPVSALEHTRGGIVKVGWIAYTVYSNELVYKS